MTWVTDTTFLEAKFKLSVINIVVCYIMSKFAW
jgi:hypothetical protein